MKQFVIAQLGDPVEACRFGDYALETADEIWTRCRIGPHLIFSVRGAAARARYCAGDRESAARRASAALQLIEGNADISDEMRQLAYEDAGQIARICGNHYSRRPAHSNAILDIGQRRVIQAESATVLGHINALHGVADAAIEAREFGLAEARLREAIEISKKQYGENSTAYAQIEGGLGKAEIRSRNARSSSNAA